MKEQSSWKSIIRFSKGSIITNLWFHTYKITRLQSCLSASLSFSGRNIAGFKEVHVFIWVASPSRSSNCYLKSYLCDSNGSLEEGNLVTLWGVHTVRSLLKVNLDSHGSHNQQTKAIPLILCLIHDSDNLYVVGHVLILYEHSQGHGQLFINI